MAGLLGFAGLKFSEFLKIRENGFCLTILDLIKFGISGYTKYLLRLSDRGCLG